MIGWYFSDSNIIVNDLVCLCLIVACIKVFKFTSLRIGMLLILTFIMIEIIFSTVLYVVDKESYN